MPSYYKQHFDGTLDKSIYGGQIPQLNFLSYVSTTPQPGWNIGDGVELADGSVYRHCLSNGAGTIEPDQGCHFTDTGLVSYTAFGVSADGTNEVTVPAQTHVLQVKDQLAGGYAIIFNGSADDDCTYGIVGNDATAADVAFKIRLDRSVNPAVVAGTSAIEVYINPYRAISQATTAVLPWCGCAVRLVSAAANYFWVKTKGPVYCSPQSGVGADNGGLQVRWREDGTLQKGETAIGGTVPAADTNQVAGYVLAGSQSGNGPLIVLGGSI